MQSRIPLGPGKFHLVVLVTFMISITFMVVITMGGTRVTDLM